jgi:hemerythrin-like domain-containing protein
MTSQNESARPDVNDMQAVHGALRDTLGAASTLVAEVEASDAERRLLLANFYQNVLAFLRVHHNSEEVLVFPLLRERCPDQRATVERAAQQHEEVLDLLATAEGSVTSWERGDSGAQPACAADLAKLSSGLAAHLQEEETTVLPLCADHLSIEEWGALPGHGMANFQGDKIWLVLGLIRQRMTQAQRDEMIAHMPPPAVDMWTGFGEAAFNKLMAEVGPPLA